MLLRWIRTAIAGSSPAAIASGALIPARELVARFRGEGGGAARASALTEAQVRAMLAQVLDEPGWARLGELVARAGDPWNADDWPDGFDPLMLCAPLCDHVAFECVRCAVGQRQGGMSCAHPRSLFGRLLPLVMHGDRSRVLEHLHTIAAVLRAEARWDPAHERRIDGD
jgi:hypothetical protein